MEPAPTHVEGLPEAVREGLDLFCQRLRVSLGDRLVSVILYGGLAKGEYAGRHSDVNVMLVLSAVDLAALDAALPAVQQAALTLRLSPLVLNEPDLRHSADAFPAKFLDMKAHHRVLFGRDVLAGLEISAEHLRLRCQQELKNLLLRLRQFYLERAHRPELIESTLTRAVSSLLSDLAVMLRLKTGAAPTAKIEIARAAAREFDLELRPLEYVLNMKAGTYLPGGPELKALYAAFMDTVQRSAERADRL